MNPKKQLLSLAVAGILGSSPILLSGTALAASTAATNQTTTATAQATTNEAVVAASTDADESSFIQTVDEAYKALREIRAARLAIFNGTPEEAIKLTDEAQKDLMVANKDMHKHALMTQKQVDDKDAYIPFDTSMALAEGFVPDEAKQAALTKANTHLEKGEKANAVEALKLANIDVSVSAAMIPAAISLKHVEDAVKLLSEKKYYEANLALKAVEDSVLVETYDINAIPAQGTKVKS
jgi:hypothetical protein